MSWQNSPYGHWNFARLHTFPTVTGVPWGCPCRCSRHRRGPHFSQRRLEHPVRNGTRAHRTGGTGGAMGASSEFYGRAQTA